jgi:hypothetical protein
LKAYADRIAAEAPSIESEWEGLRPRIEWHCQSGHGVLRDIPAENAGRVQRVIEWYYGAGACRWTSTVNGLRSVEWVPMTKVFPPPTKPWEWCGKTVLFEDWQRQERETREAIRSFTPGEAVWFEYKHERKDGFVSHLNAKTVAVTVPGEGGWRIPPQDLHKVGA